MPAVDSARRGFRHPGRATRGPGGEDTRPNRLSGLGALFGTATGVGKHLAYGAVTVATLHALDRD